MLRALKRSLDQRATVGVDAGGTRTRAVVIDEGGRRTLAEAGPANWTTLGRDQCAAAISEAVDKAATAAGLSAGDLASTCVALAGYYPPWHEQEVRASLAPLFPDARLRLEPDLVAAWAGATGGEPGIVLVAGTGAVAYGRNHEGRTARAGGWGPLFGDEGGGYWIGCEALRAVARSLDGREPASTLAERLWLWDHDFARAHDDHRPAEPFPGGEHMLRAVYRDQWPRERVARLAIPVAAAAIEGEVAALLILERAADELAALVEAVARRLGEPGEPLRLIGVGGVLEAGALIRAPIERRLAEALPHACWTEPVGAPVEGALLLAQPEGKL